jgi:hypothetical protein
MWLAPWRYSPWIWLGPPQVQSCLVQPPSHGHPAWGKGYPLGPLHHAHCPVFMTLVGAAGPGGVTVVPRRASCTTWGKCIKVDASRRRAAREGEGAWGCGGA